MFSEYCVAFSIGLPEKRPEKTFKPHNGKVVREAVFRFSVL